MVDGVTAVSRNGGIAALDDRLALERLIAELSSAFINLPAYPEQFPWILDQPLSGKWCASPA